MIPPDQLRSEKRLGVIGVLLFGVAVAILLHLNGVYSRQPLERLQQRLAYRSAISSHYRVKDLVWAEEIWWATFHGGDQLEYGPSLRDIIEDIGKSVGGISVHDPNDAMIFLTKKQLLDRREVWEFLEKDFEPEYNPPWDWCFDWIEGNTEEGYF